ncbi:MAG TPA: uroporphyrinogen-III synthase [Terriglobales bacterium]|nr:uroporphyrinogen-III synthase [Terriglobales bacterium]
MKRARRPSPPLASQRVLVTRARRQAGALAALLRQQGATVIEIPSIEIRPPRSYRPLDRALRRIADYDWLVLTSVNGVEALFARLKKLRLTARQLKALRIAAIGPATRAAIQKRGLRVQVMPREYVAESVVAALRGQVRGKRVLLVRAKVARDVLPRDLRRAGARVDVIEAYQTVVPARSRRRLQALLRSPARRPHVITFTSSSTARNFMDLLGRKRESRKLLDGIAAASIGPVTSATLRDLGLPPGIQARSYTIPGLVAAIVAKRRPR